MAQSGTRTLSISKKFSLADVADGWDDCYLLYRPLTPRDIMDMQTKNLESMSNADGVEYMLELIKSHTTGGKVLADGEVVDLETSDLDMFGIDTITAIFRQFRGDFGDPKDSSTATETSLTPPATSEH